MDDELIEGVKNERLDINSFVLLLQVSALARSCTLKLMILCVLLFYYNVLMSVLLNNSSFPFSSEFIQAVAVLIKRTYSENIQFVLPIDCRVSNFPLK